MATASSLSSMAFSVMFAWCVTSTFSLSNLVCRRVVYRRERSSSVRSSDMSIMAMSFAIGDSADAPGDRASDRSQGCFHALDARGDVGESAADRPMPPIPSPPTESFENRCCA